MTSSTRARKTRRRTPRGGGRLRRVAGVLLGLLVFAGVAGSLATVGVVNYYAGDLPSIANVDETALPQTSRIVDRNGSLIEVLYHENRTVVPLARISVNLRRATVATEDRTFYQNAGVDYRRIAISAVLDVTHHSAAYGGSTITQQVVKNTLLKDQAQDKALGRKIKEILLAEELQRRYSKDQILELYLNTINYGNGALGAEAAAQTYFGLHAADLDAAQAAFLAGLPQYPVGYNPFGNQDQVAAAHARFADVVRSEVAAGALTPAEADKASAEDIWKQMADHHAQAGGRDPRTAHFVDYVLGYLESKYSDQQIYEGGLVVQTSLDLPTQLAADAAVKAGVKTYAAKGANTGALLAMNPADGEILAMVGSADYNNAAIRGQVNLTGVDPSGYRPVGSSFKAYTYAAGLELGQVNAASKVDDQNSVIDGHRYYDWDSRTEGMIPLRQALQESRNLPALWTYRSVTGARVVGLAQRLGVSTPIQTPASLPTTLGTNSMSMVEHLAAYSAFDNGGNKVIAHPVLKVTDDTGRVLEAFDQQPSRDRVISPELGYLVTDILRGPPRMYLGYGSQPVAAKSGTTESWTGAYWIGYTPNLAVATYMAHIDAGDTCNSGFARLADGFQASGWLCPTNVLWGEHVGLSVWKPFLDSYYKTHAWPAAWTKPAGIITRPVCKADGSLAAPSTPGDQRYDEIFIQGSGEPGPGQCAAAAAAPSPSPSPSAPAPPHASPSPH